MKIGIFSDIHDNIVNLEKTKIVFENFKIEHAFFCGDLVSPFTLKFLSQWPFPIKAVFGNNEGDKWGFKRRFDKYQIKNIEYPERGLAWDLELQGKKIATFHGHSPVITEALVTCQKYDLVLTGHTHEAHIKKEGKTLWINPGSVTGVSENPEITKASVAIYDFENNKAEIVYL